MEQVHALPILPDQIFIPLILLLVFVCLVLFLFIRLCRVIGYHLEIYMEDDADDQKGLQEEVKKVEEEISMETEAPKKEVELSGATPLESGDILAQDEVTHSSADVEVVKDLAKKAKEASIQ